MTVVPAKHLTNQELDQLGNNIKPAVKQTEHRMAVNRSLAAVGEELCEHDDIDLAIQSEAAAS
jgi:hypothetical protein